MEMESYFHTIERNMNGIDLLLQGKNFEAIASFQEGLLSLYNSTPTASLAVDINGVSSQQSFRTFGGSLSGKIPLKLSSVEIRSPLSGDDGLWTEGSFLCFARAWHVDLPKTYAQYTTQDSLALLQQALTTALTVNVGVAFHLFARFFDDRNYCSMLLARAQEFYNMTLKFLLNKPEGEPLTNAQPLFCRRILLSILNNLGHIESYLGNSENSQAFSHCLSRYLEQEMTMDGFQAEDDEVWIFLRNAHFDTSLIDLLLYPSTAAAA